ncbi:(E2-independent) E3 ubiquitin-conjugating enzyme FATS isoform X2 [Peromyscus californicus insignis]|uniref:(E2-independent) E3 ubiquitin-conjugating enzyme FATS isoform X2 n=1 Tax=Peromyscus californicus insignis TaxID=564181 RepID=UPI0022A7DA08|nr:(E2-independent) E3 ubiquitin-conjugating enzyme FATS isoform X2 [Peromyscus californicus insignis]
MPVKPPEEGKIVLPTFQITAFSTSLKNHVMVMDLVKRDWLPSQRRAKVCFIQMCPGLKVAEQQVSRYEMNSRLFSSPNDDSAWERNETLSKAGLLDTRYSTNDQIALKNLQSDVTERKLDFAKETLASQNTKMISPIIISQLIDEKKSMENGALLPLPQAIVQPQLCPTKPASARRSGVNMHRPFAPDRLGILTPSDEQGLAIEPLSTGDNLGRGPHRGFSSITITARRVGPPANSLVWDTVRDPLCPNCRAKDTLLQDAPALASGVHLCQHNGSFTCTEFPGNGSIEGLKVPQAHTRMCARQEYWVTHMDDKEDSFSSDSSPSRKVPLMFSSCVHLRVSQHCPSAIYYLDKPLSVPLEQPQIASPKMHRSVLSLSLRCSSHRLTADGVDSTANGEPISRALPQELLEGKQDLLGPQWGQPQEGHWKESPALVPAHLGSGTYPQTGSPPLENVKFADVGRNQVPRRKEKGDCAACPTSNHANQLSIHIPGWSYRAETKVFSGNSKEQQGEAQVTLPASPVGQKPIKHFPPDGDSSPSNDGQSSIFSEPQERRHPYFLTPRVPLSGFLCPVQAACASLQEDGTVQIEKEFPKDYTCCDLVVKLKEYKKHEDHVATPEPSPATPSPTMAEGPQSSDPLEDSSEPRHLLASSMTLQEALEVRRPQFISRSQERLQKLKHMVQQRKTQQKENPGQKQSLLPVRAHKKQFTVPHPLSDNLFKPKERCISEKEMHMRSKRIYNNLPEVKKKKEEQKKRVILQSNRLRAEVFKKQLLDQLLQRNAV